MKCEWVRENIVLEVYGELADDARHELEQHVARCARLRSRTEGGARVSRAAGADRATEPSPNLVASSRMRLQEALETAKQGSFFSRLAFDPANWLLQMKFSPALASAILILGFAGGIGATYKLYGSHATVAQGPIRQRARHQLPPKPRSQASVPSCKTPAPTRSASSTTPYQRRKHRDR